MNIAICNADKSQREVLEKHLQAYLKQKGEGYFAIHQFNTGEELLKSRRLFHICFLYVRRKEELQLGKKLQSVCPNCLLMLITELDDCMDEAFNIGAFRLYKVPINVKRFYCGLDAAQQRINKISIAFHDFRMNADVRVPIADIIYIETAGRKTKIVSNRHVWYAKEHLADWEEKLAGMRFMHPHASYLVNMDYAIQHKREELLLVARTENGELGEGYVIPISAKHQAEMKQQFYKHIKESYHYL